MKSWLVPLSFQMFYVKCQAYQELDFAENPIKIRLQVLPQI